MLSIIAWGVRPSPILGTGSWLLERIAASLALTLCMCAGGVEHVDPEGGAYVNAATERGGHLMKSFVMLAPQVLCLLGPDDEVLERWSAVCVRAREVLGMGRGRNAALWLAVARSGDRARRGGLGAGGFASVAGGGARCARGCVPVCGRQVLALSSFAELSRVLVSGVLPLSPALLVAAPPFPAAHAVGEGAFDMLALPGDWLGHAALRQSSLEGARCGGWVCSRGTAGMGTEGRRAGDAWGDGEAPHTEGCRPSEGSVAMGLGLVQSHVGEASATSPPQRGGRALAPRQGIEPRTRWARPRSSQEGRMTARRGICIFRAPAFICR